MPASGLPQDDRACSRPNPGSDSYAPQTASVVHAGVLSVSPRSIAVAPPETRDGCDEHIRAVQDATDSLRALITQAHHVNEGLAAATTHARETESQAMKTAVHLQERLRLGAQMIKAFQTQIGRIESSLAQLSTQERRAEAAETRLLQHIANANCRLDETLSAALQRMEACATGAMEKMNQAKQARAAMGAERAAPDESPVVEVTPPFRLHTWTANGR